MSTATVTPPDSPGTPAEPPSPQAAVGADEGRIGLRANLRHVGALMRRNALQIKQDPESMMDALLMPIVFTLLFVYVFGGAIGGGGQDDSNEEYTQYLVPGMMAMMSTSLAMGVGTGLNEDFAKGVMDRFRSMPIARSSVLLAKAIVEAGRLLVAIVVLMTVGVLVGFNVDGRWLGLLAATGLTVLFGFSLMWIFMVMGLSLPNAQAVQQASFLILMPLQFGSSVFVPPETMPSWLEAFTSFNPLTQVADAARGLMIGQGAVASPVMWTLVWVVGLTAVTAPLAITKFRKKT